MDDRDRRISANETLFREVNDRIEELDATLGVPTRKFTIVCECGRLSCAEHISVGHDEYRELRADPTTFLVLPGHEDPRVETVVDTREGFYIIRKREGEPAELARANF
jgi:hypothetical protein